jgi:hypothetical protein
MLEYEAEGRKHRAVSCDRFTSDEALGCPSPQHPDASTIFWVGPASQKAPAPLHPFVKVRYLAGNGQQGIDTWTSCVIQYP